MELKIYPETILRKKTEPVTDEDITELYSQLVAAMINHEGIGLAAPQVGIDKSIAVVSEKVDENLKKPLLLVNPEIVECSGRQSIEEGCLSVKGITANVPRHEYIKVETGLENKRVPLDVTGLISIVIQHEIDHLNGILFPDRLKFPKKYWCLLKARLKKKYGKKD